MKDFSKAVAAVVLIVALVAGLGILAQSGHTVSAAPSTFAPISCDTPVAISSASSVQIYTAPNVNMFGYICSLGLGSIGGSNFSIVEGTGSTCGTGTLAMFGGTTAATGIGLAANGIFDEGSGTGFILRTKVAGDNICILMSGTGPLAGNAAMTIASY